jgi:hypothetical protein
MARPCGFQQQSRCPAHGRCDPRHQDATNRIGTQPRTSSSLSSRARDMLDRDRQDAPPALLSDRGSVDTKPQTDRCLRLQTACRLWIVQFVRGVGLCSCHAAFSELAPQERRPQLGPQQLRQRGQQRDRVQMQLQPGVLLVTKT